MPDEGRNQQLMKQITQDDEDALRPMSSGKDFNKSPGTPPAGPKGGMFVNAGEMKEKMRAQLAKPVYDVRNFYKEKGIWQYMARHPLFDKCSLSVIAFNAIWIAVDTDYNDSSVLTDAAWPFQVADHFFCAFFFSEWAVRFFAFKEKRNGLKDAWFVFDGIMVTLMVLETWVMTFVLWIAGVDGSSMGSTSVLKLIRMTRLTRMARMARLLRAMPELLVLLKGMWAATRSVFFTLLLLFIIIYVFGIAFTQVAGGSRAGAEYFQSVPASMHTLLLRGTLMDDMYPVIKALDSSSRMFAVVFYIFILISSLTVMNMLIGVLCEVVAAVAATEKEESSVAFVKWQIRDIMRKGGLDLDGDGMISKGEFVQILDNPIATRTLSNAGVDVFGLVDCADFIFDGEEVKEEGLSFADFMEVVLQLRGTNLATVKDIVDLRKFVSVETKKLHEGMMTLKDRVARMSQAVPVSTLSSTWVADEAPSLPESSSFQAERAVPSKREVHLREGPAYGASVVPVIDILEKPANVDALPAHFAQVCLELDQLRQYVDTELDAIVADIRRKPEDLPAVFGSGRESTGSLAPPGRLPGNHLSTPAFPSKPVDHQFAHSSDDLPSGPASSAAREKNSLMCPGAELKCCGSSQSRGMSCGMPL